MRRRLTHIAINEAKRTVMDAVKNVLGFGK